MKLEVLLQALEPGVTVRINGEREVTPDTGVNYEYLVPEGMLEQKVTSLNLWIEPVDPGIRLMLDVKVADEPGDRFMTLDDLFVPLDLEDEAEIHITRGTDKLGHASPSHIRDRLSNSTLESIVRSIRAELDPMWELLLHVDVA